MEYLDINDLSQEEVLQVRDEALDILMACDSRLLYMSYLGEDTITGRCYNA